MTVQAIGLSEAVVARIRQVAARHGVRSVRVFGSHARGEARPDSDVDLLIELEPGRGFVDLVAFCEGAEAALGKKADVVTEDALSPYLRDQVIAEAVAL